MENRLYCHRCKRYCDEVIQVTNETKIIKRVFDEDSYKEVEILSIEENRSDIKCSICRNIISYS